MKQKCKGNEFNCLAFIKYDSHKKTRDIGTDGINKKIITDTKYYKY